jgi:hypothetical protein
MKKILALFLGLSITFVIFAGCNKTPAKETESTTKQTSSNVIIKISGDTFAEDFSEIEFYEALDSIEGVFHTKNTETNEYTLQMTEAAYKKLKDVKSKEVLNGFDEIKKNSENYVTEIEYNEDFRNIKVIADREKLPEGSISMLDDTVLKIISQAMAYQIYTVEGQRVNITVINSESEEVLKTVSYPVVIQ